VIEVNVPEHMVDIAGDAVAEDPGSGLTVIVAVIGTAAQPLAVAVIV
jgi:hypothetical protein